ncbi:MAG: hypothetical protein Q9227_006814 [Pyrenula ochraceoflavens]
MADPGTALGAISLGIQVSQALMNYYESFRAYDQAVPELLSDVKSLQESLQSVEKVIKTPASLKGSETDVIKQHMESKVMASYKAIQKLDAECRKLGPDHSRSGFTTSIKNQRRKATWPLSKRRLVPIQAAVTRARRDLLETIQTSQLDSLGRLQEFMVKAKSRENAMLSLRYFVLTFEQVKSRTLSDRGCRRLTTQQDIEMRVPNIKIAQAPGFFGKVVSNLGDETGAARSYAHLDRPSSTIIEELKAVEGAENGHTVLFYYFAYNERITSEALIRSLLNQLAFTSGTCAPALMELYESSRHGPTLEQFLETFLSIIDTFDHVFIVLDALDEIQDQLDVWEVIKPIAEATHSHIHLLLISRGDVGISQHIIAMHPAQITMLPQMVNDDIKIMIDDVLSNDPKLKKFSRLHLDIESNLVGKADGM